MTQNLAMFPLELVVFPGERLALHIFENRYQQLIADCELQNMIFGIPAFFNGKLSYGTEVRLEKVEKRYPSGASDIVCRGLWVFKIESFYPVYNEKMYSGAAVTFLNTIEDGTAAQRDLFFNLAKRFHALLGADSDLSTGAAINSYSFPHKLGLSFKQELELLKLYSESARYVYVIDHLTVTLPVVEQMNRTRELIQLNGHFKNFDPLDFTDYKLDEL
ncbi:LON peptidase substrate-binding domain-containing protein [Leeuwenhoekiella marinoflava]|nr:LON peptidase substrate-binding domain-containing protein [Leeuwenhoekiella marinoflava]